MKKVLVHTSSYLQQSLSGKMQQQISTVNHSSWKELSDRDGNQLRDLTSSIKQLSSTSRDGVDNQLSSVRDSTITIPHVSPEGTTHGNNT